jgi:hypothetical protein
MNLILVIVACAVQTCIPLINHEQSAAAAREACLVRLEVMLDLAEELLSEDPVLARENHAFSWDCLPLDLVNQRQGEPDQSRRGYEHRAGPQPHHRSPHSEAAACSARPFLSRSAGANHMGIASPAPGEILKGHCDLRRAGVAGVAGLVDVVR